MKIGDLQKINPKVTVLDAMEIWLEK